VIFGTLNINKYVCKDINAVLNSIRHNIKVEEIRLRANRPLMLNAHLNSDWFVELDGYLSRQLNENTLIVKQHQIEETLELISQNSIYAYQEDIRNGYITIEGGHRVGITGKVVMDSNSIKSMKNISGLNIRVAKQIKGCSSSILKYIRTAQHSVYNTLIISPPQCGKTTILRDIVRCISDGDAINKYKGMKVVVIDERSEIAASDRGIPQNDVGLRTDVLDSCPKTIGMYMALRSMSPHVIITDEIGSSSDKDSIIEVMNAGIKIITTAHGYSISHIKNKTEILGLIDRGVFERFVILSAKNGPGTLEEVVDGITMNSIYRREST